MKNDLKQYKNAESKFALEPPVSIYQWNLFALKLPKGNEATEITRSRPFRLQLWQSNENKKTHAKFSEL